MLKPSRHNPALHPWKAVCNDPFGAHQTNLPQHRRSEHAGFTDGQRTTEHIFAIRKIFEKSKEFNKSTSLLLSTSKLPMTQCPVTPCGKFFKCVAFHGNFLFVCVNCTQTPAARCASLLLCQKSSPSRLA